MSKPQKRRTQAERTEASDKAMYKAAIKLIARDGPEKMTLARLGKEAGFTGGLVSYRFGTKSNLLQATATRILELWTDRVIKPVHADQGGIKNLELMGKLYIDAVVAKSDLMIAQYRLMNESYAAYSDKELHKTYQDFDRDLRQRIVDGLQPEQDQGRIDTSIDLYTFAVLFIAMLRGIALQYFIDSKAIDIQAAYKLVEGTCGQLLAPE